MGRALHSEKFIRSLTLAHKYIDTQMRRRQPDSCKTRDGTHEPSELVQCQKRGGSPLTRRGWSAPAQRGETERNSAAQALQGSSARALLWRVLSPLLSRRPMSAGTTHHVRRSALRTRQRRVCRTHLRHRQQNNHRRCPAALQSQSSTALVSRNLSLYDASAINSRSC